MFTVTLVNVTVGASVGSFSTSLITIAANDHPYGLFTFASPPSDVTEGSEVIVTVVREFGSVGQVSVGVASVESDDARLNSLQLDLVALRNTEYVHACMYLTLAVYNFSLECPISKLKYTFSSS